MNGDDRWPNVLSRRLKGAPWQQGCGGERRIERHRRPGRGRSRQAEPAGLPQASGSIATCSRCQAFLADLARGHERLQKNGNASADQVIAAMKDGVERLRKKWPQLRIIGATVVSALGSFQCRTGFPDKMPSGEGPQRLLTAHQQVFDGVIDFRMTLDPASRRPQAGVRSDSTTGSPRQASSQSHRISGDGSGDRSRSFKPGGASAEREGTTVIVGWVERSDTHHRGAPIHATAMMGIASLHPSYKLLWSPRAAARAARLE